MARIKRGVTAHARHQKVRKLAKGYRGRGKNVYRVAIERVEKALQYQYRDRQFRSLWIQRINAAVRSHDEAMTYATFIDGIAKAGIEVDRKVLADIAVHEPDAFASLVAQAKAARASA